MKPQWQIRGFISRNLVDNTMTTVSSLPHWRSAVKLSIMIVFALVVLVIPIGGQAKADVLFAAIWQKDNGPAFQARHGLTGPQYQQTFDQLVGQGFRLTYVNGYTVGGEPHFAAIWEKDGGPAFQARHGLTGPQYQQTFDQLVGQGFRLRVVSGYEVPSPAPPPPNFTCAVCNNGSCQCGSQTGSQLCANRGGVNRTLGCIQQQ